MQSLENTIEQRLIGEGVEHASTLAALIAVDIDQKFTVRPKVRLEDEW